MDSPSEYPTHAGVVHDEVRREMRRLLQDAEPLPFLNKGAHKLLAEARASYERLELARHQLLQAGSEVRILTWRGDRVNDTLAIWLTRLDLEASNEGLTVGVFDASRHQVRMALARMATGPAPSEAELAQAVKNPTEQKWDWTLPDGLLRKGYGRRRFDVEGVQRACAAMLQGEQD